MKNIAYLILSGLLLMITGCEKDPEPANFAPQLTTSESSGVFRTGATLSGEIVKADGVVVKEYGILYSTLQSMAEYEMKAADNDNNGKFSVQLTELEAGQTYYYCAYAASGYSIAKGEIKKFITVPSEVPVFSTLQIDHVNEKSFVANTSILDEGGSSLVLKGFCWKETANNSDEPKMTDASKNLESFDDFEWRVNDLKPGRQYAVRAFAINGNGLGYGATTYVFTAATNLPVVSSCQASDSTQNSIKMLARILANASSVTEKGFCYSPTNELPTVTDMREISTIPDTVIYGTVGGLTPGNTYYIRAYATSSLGTGYGDVFSYTIPGDGQQAVPPVIDQTIVRDITTHTASAVAVVISNGGGEITESGFYYSTTHTLPDEQDPHVSSLTAGSNITANLTGLEEGQTYYIRAYAINQVGLSHGAVSNFQTESITLPVVKTGTITNVASASASLSGTITSLGNGTLQRKGFCWSTTHTSPSLEQQDGSSEVSTEGSTYFYELTGLSGKTKYYVRAYAENEKGLSYGETQEFVTGTSAVAPTLGGTTVSEIGETSAKATATVVSNGGASVSGKGFCYSLTNSSPTIENGSTILTDASTGNSITGALKNLVANAKYYIRAYATNGEGTAYGVVNTFSTQKASSTPKVGATVVNAVTKTTAEVSSGIDNDGGAAVTEKGFCYSTTNTAPTISDNKISSDISKVDFTGSLETLAMNTQYYIRAYAVNINGISYGETNSFTTRSDIPNNSDNPSPDK